MQAQVPITMSNFFLSVYEKFGVLTFLLLAGGYFFYKGVWPLIIAHIQALDTTVKASTNFNQLFLTQHAEVVRSLLSDQLHYQQSERASELKRFLTALERRDAEFAKMSLELTRLATELETVSRFQHQHTELLARLQRCSSAGKCAALD